MFSMTFGFVLLVLAVIIRDWAMQDEQDGKLEDAQMGSIVALCTVVLGVIFVVSGVAGV